MSETNQSLIKVFLNSDNDVVLIYGNVSNCDIQHVELERLVINRNDVSAIIKALNESKLIIGDDDGES